MFELLIFTWNYSASHHEKGCFVVPPHNVWGNVSGAFKTKFCQRRQVNESRSTHRDSVYHIDVAERLDQWLRFYATFFFQSKKKVE